MKLILDTDIDTDCDDAGALAVLHHLANQGKAEILGIVCSIPIPACVSCIRAINQWYKRPDIPVAMVSPEAWESNPSHDNYLEHRKFLVRQGRLYNEQIATEFNKSSDFETPDAVKLYRKLLSEQSNKSVTICAIGTLTALAGLLHSDPDEISVLSGREMIAQKVRLLVSMAVASYPEGKDGFNWRMDLPSAATVVNEWPTPIAVQPAGGDVLTGRRFMAEAPADNPVRQAYTIWLGSKYKERSSWDQLTVIYAVNGAGDLFSEKSSLSLSLDSETGMHRWFLSEGEPERIYIDTVADSNVLSSTVEELMISSVKLG